jgi:hypothetical protein
MTIRAPVGKNSVAVVLERKTKRASRVFRESARQVKTSLSRRGQQLQLEPDRGARAVSRRREAVPRRSVAWEVRHGIS